MGKWGILFLIGISPNIFGGGSTAAPPKMLPNQNSSFSLNADPLTQSSKNCYQLNLYAVNSGGAPVSFVIGNETPKSNGLGSQFAPGHDVAVFANPSCTSTGNVSWNSSGSWVCMTYAPYVQKTQNMKCLQYAYGTSVYIQAKTDSLTGVNAGTIEVQATLNGLIQKIQRTIPRASLK